MHSFKKVCEGGFKLEELLSFRLCFFEENEILRSKQGNNVRMTNLQHLIFFVKMKLVSTET